MKKIIFTFLVAALSVAVKAQINEAALSYINQYKKIAIDEMIRTGVPASITLAQGLLESSCGQCPLVQQSNNHFGIKCKTDWVGDVVYHDDDEKGECFRKYNSAEDSYRDHSDFLKNRPNYTFLFDIDATDYADWAYGLKKAGYATNPVYAQSLITTIERYNLEQYTELALLQNNQIDIAAPPVKSNEEIEFASTGKITSNNNNVPAVNNNASPKYPTGVFQINKTNVLYAEAGTSLFAIANKFSIPFNKLLQYNDLKNSDILPQGSLIYLEKKPKKGSKDFHLVAINEKLEDIAQEEGIQLESLLAYNNYQKNVQPKPGDKILLRTDNKKLF